jgi:hypothetical protein
MVVSIQPNVDFVHLIVYVIACLLACLSVSFVFIAWRTELFTMCFTVAVLGKKEERFLSGHDASADSPSTANLKIRIPHPKSQTCNSIPQAVNPHPKP